MSRVNLRMDSKTWGHYNCNMGKTLHKPKNLPNKPGVYLFKDASRKIIYIGKAKNLRARVAQYFSRHDTRPQIPYLMAESRSLDYTVVDNELESLYLERNLIQKHRPKYNIDLKDDKNFAFISIDYAFQIPQIGYARKLDPKRKDVVYFGPYTAASKIKTALKTVRHIFPYCAAQKITGKPCFYYHLHRCPGVCVGAISPAEYRQILEKIKIFLSGKTDLAAKQIRKDMRLAAKTKKFEAAARYRDQLKSLAALEAKQKIILTKPENWDIIASYQDGFFACINLFQVRNGRLNASENFVYELGSQSLDSPLEDFLESYYLETSNLPNLIHIEEPPKNLGALASILENRSSKKIRIKSPSQGKLRALIKLSQQNAKEYLEQWLSGRAGNLDKLNHALEQLKNVLNLPRLPLLIEGYDISNLQGTNPVGSMVVFKDGLPAKSFYKKFRIQTKNTPDDFAMMREMLKRRAEKFANPDAKWPKPDLIVIDGGKGQLSAALKILNPGQTPLSIPVIGLAKRIEEIFLPGKAVPVVLDHSQPALQLLQRLRDEAHRFGVTYHKKLRSRQATKSALDEIPGVGPKTKKILKQKFGTISSIRQASLEELAQAVGPGLAKIIKNRL